MSIGKRGIRAGRQLVCSTGLFIALVSGLAGCGTPGPSAVTAFTVEADTTLLIVAVDDTPEAMAGAGAAPRASYNALYGYAGSLRAAAVADALAQENRLREQAAWTITPLRLRCMLYRTTAGRDPEAVMAALARDSRVRLVQPLNTFETLQSPATTPALQATGLAPPERVYDDPYFRLQRGLVTIKAAPAQRWSRGDGVRIALIDTGVVLGLCRDLGLRS